MIVAKKITRSTLPALAALALTIVSVSSASAVPTPTELAAMEREAAVAESVA